MLKTKTFHRQLVVAEQLVKLGAEIYCYFFSGRKPRVKSLGMDLTKNGRKLKLICKIKSKNQKTQILWRKDGAPIQTDQSRIKIRQRRYFSHQILFYYLKWMLILDFFHCLHFLTEILFSGENPCSLLTRPRCLTAVPTPA